MEARAIKRYIPSSPKKMRIVADLIRNKNVQDGLQILRFTKKHASEEVFKTLKSAYDNLLAALDVGKLDMDKVKIKSVSVDGGPTLKRIRPAPQGRAYRIRKRSAHLSIVVEYEEEEKKEIKEQVVKEEAPQKKVKTAERKPKKVKEEVIEEEVQSEVPEEEVKKEEKKEEKVKEKKKTKGKTTLKKDKTKEDKNSDEKLKKKEEKPKKELKTKKNKEK